MLNNPFTAPGEAEVFAYGLSTTIGDTVTIGGIEYLIVHNDTTNKHLYLAKKYEVSTENTKFNPSVGQTTYEGSTIHTKCKTWHQQKIPENIKPLLVTLDCGYGCPVFIPTLAQVAATTKTGSQYQGSGEWSYFVDDDSRRFKDGSGSVYSWWLQSQWPDDSSRVCLVNTAGNVNRNTPNLTLGFRPCFAIKYNSMS